MTFIGRLNVDQITYEVNNDSRFAHFFLSSEILPQSEKSIHRNDFSDLPKFPLN
jgi:hypothetical protein